MLHCSDATNKTVTWSSSCEAVATVSNGTVTAVAEGTATITVRTEDGGLTATCAVTVAADAPVNANEPVIEGGLGTVYCGNDPEDNSERLGRRTYHQPDLLKRNPDRLIPVFRHGWGINNSILKGERHWNNHFSCIFVCR